MKILYGITKSNFGGAQRYVFELAVEAKKKGFDVSILCGADGTLADKLRGENVRVMEIETLRRNVSPLDDIKSFLKIYKILKQEQPDIFHINSSKMGSLGGLAGQMAGIKKIIFTSHGWAFNEPRPKWQKIIIKFFAWLTIMFSGTTICVSEKTKNDVEKLPFIKDKLVVVHNGISNFNLVTRVDDTLTIGAIAELHRIKGLDILLTAWSKFIKNREAKLVIIGEGEERKNLVELASQLEISQSVFFKGYLENARSYLSNFDIFCIPSRSEALPFVLLEAGLAERPVIATSVGGIPEVIESGINGVLVPAEDADILLSTLILLAEDRDLRKRLGANLKSTIEENFSFEKMLRDTLNLYEI